MKVRTGSVVAMVGLLTVCFLATAWAAIDYDELVKSVDEARIRHTIETI